MSEVMNDFEQEATGLAGQMEAELKSIGNDAMLSPEGKAQRAQAVRERYQKATETLQARATEALTTLADDLDAKAKKAMSEAAAKRREVLGPVVYADLIRRRVDTMSPDEVLKAHEEAADDFEREIIASYGLLQLQGRDDAAAHVLALQRAMSGQADELLTQARQARHNLKRIPETVTAFKDELLRARFNLRR